MTLRSATVVALGLVLMVVLSLAGCTKRAASAPDGWRRANADGRFSFAVPRDMKQQDVQGIDSYVGLLLSDRCRLSFDYGFYSPDPPAKGQPNVQHHEETRIDGRDAITVTYTDPQASDGLVHVSQVYFAKLRDPRISEEVQLAMFMQCPDDQKVPTALQIFHSIRFP